jgi:uncharacterized membrane protein affecting hemolysin expression
MKLNQPKTSPFSKTFLMISFITIAALIGLEINAYTSRKTQLETHFSSFFQSTSNRLETLLTTPLWNFEIDRLKAISEIEIKEHHMIHSISIYEKTANREKQMIFCITKDASGQLISCQGDPKGTNIESTRNLKKNNILIGTLKICFSKKIIDQQKQNLFQEIVVRLFFLIVIVIAGLFMAARSLVR